MDIFQFAGRIEKACNVVAFKESFEGNSRKCERGVEPPDNACDTLCVKVGILDVNIFDNWLRYNILSADNAEKSCGVPARLVNV